MYIIYIHIVLYYILYKFILYWILLESRLFERLRLPGLLVRQAGNSWDALAFETMVEHEKRCWHICRCEYVFTDYIGDSGV